MSKIKKFFKTIGDKISRVFSKIAETKVMRGISNALSWLPNKVGDTNKITLEEMYDKLVLLFKSRKKRGVLCK